MEDKEILSASLDAIEQTSPNVIVDWNGKDDPENPRNFTLLRRTLSTAAVTLLAFVSTFGGSIYSPAHEEVARLWNISPEVAILPLALYNAGLAFGPMFGAPLCETFGRKVVFLMSTPIFGLFILGSSFSQNPASLIVCRFFAGVFAAPAISNASATIVDYTAGRYRAISLAVYYAVPTFGAVFGPLVGGLITEAKGWRWTQYVTLFLLLTLYVPIFFTKETYKKTILQRRAKRLGLTYPDPYAGWSILQVAGNFLTTLFLRPLHMLFTEPIVTLVCLYNGYMFGLFYTFVVASPWIYSNYYGFDLTGQALSFLGLIIGALISPIPLILIDFFCYQPRLKRWRESHPSTEVAVNAVGEDTRFPAENRLFSSMGFCLVLPASLFAFAWSTQASITFVVPIIFQAISVTSSLAIYASTSLYVLDTYGPLYGASAAGAAMICRYALSTAFPLFALKMYQRLGVAWATTILACCAMAFVPVPFLFWKYGKGLRGRGKYEWSA